LNRKSICAALTLVAASAMMFGQNVEIANNQPTTTAGNPYAVTSTRTATRPNYSLTPFSRLAFGVGVSSLGINMQTAVNANRYMNLRGSANFFDYSLNKSLDGLLASGSLNFASAGASVDFYPFPFHGLRLSPGVLFYNQNRATATLTAPGGSSFTLDGTTFYSSQANPVTGGGSLSLHQQSPVFTMTTGWGNMISRRGGHFSFPFEIGAAFMGSPSVSMALNGGQVCLDPAGTIGCMNVVGNEQVQSDLSAQQTKYQNDLNPFRIYPIVSTGIAYNFSLSHGPARVR